MRTINDIKAVVMTVDEIRENCFFFEENRNRFLNPEEAAAHFFSKSDTKKTISRVNSYKRNIFKKDKKWKDCSPMIIYVVDGKKFIVDGQGRFLAIELYNSEVEDSEKITEIPVLLYENRTYHDMVFDALSMNTKQKNWSTDDVYRALCLAQGDSENAKMIVGLKTKYEDELGCSAYTAKLILFGPNKASHRDAVNEGIKLSPYHKIFFKAFDTFYKIAVDSCYENQTEINSIMNQNVSIAFYRLMKYIIVYCNKVKENFEPHLMIASEQLGNYIGGLDRKYKFKQVLGGKENSISSYFIRALGRKQTDAYIKNAMVGK